MPKLLDLTGRKFGKLTVLSRSDKNVRNTPWNCVCDCGKELVVTRVCLMSGDSKSCGCRRVGLERPNYKSKHPHGYAARNRLMRIYRKHAFTRNLEWDIDDQEFIRITAMDCRFCGKPPLQKMSEGKCGDILYNGVDRLDNSKGYVIGNVVPACYECNRAKFKSTETDFLDWIKRVYNHMKLGES